MEFRSVLVETKDVSLEESSNIERMLYNVSTTLDKIAKQAKKEFKEGDRLAKVLMDIASDLEEEIMFIQNGEYE